MIRREIEGISNTDNFPADERYGIESMVREYAESFVGMARLGFISMDVDEDGRFCVIAEPKENEHVPDDILAMLPEGRIDDLLK